MNQTARLILFTLLTCLISASVYADEAASGKQLSVPSLLPSVPQPVSKPVIKTADGSVSLQSTRFGQVDMARVAADSEAGKAGQAELTELKKKLQSQIDLKRKQLDKLKTAIEAKLKTLTAQQREAKSKEFQKKIEDFQKAGLKAEKELQAKQLEISDKLFKAIEQASAELGKSKGLALVVIKRELLYLGSGVDALDLTDEVITKIDKK